MHVRDGRLGELLFRRAERRPLEHPQQVAGSEDGADGGDHHVAPEQCLRQALGRVVGGQNGGELAPEAGQAGQAEGGHGAKAQDPPHAGSLDEQAAEARQLQGVEPVLHRPGDEEQHPGDEAVRHHAEHGGVDAEVGQGGDAEHHVAHVGHRRKGDEALHVALRQARQGPVDDADHRQPADPRRPDHGGFGEDGDGDAHEPVGAELQQDGGEDHRPLGGGLGVGVGQPGVEREHRHLDGEAHEQAAEDEQLGGADQVAGHVPLDEQRDVERGLQAPDAALEVEGEEGEDHQGRAEQREQEELERGVLPVLTAPHPDHEVHRQQDQLEEHEEQDEVLGHERAEHARLQDEHQHEEGLGVAGLGPVVPAVDDAQRGDHHRQQEQRQAHAVHEDVVVRVDDVDPRVVPLELGGAGGVVVEPQHQVEPARQGEDRGAQRPGLDQELLPLRDEAEHGGPAERGEGGHRQQRVVEVDVAVDDGHVVSAPVEGDGEDDESAGGRPA